MKGIMLQGTSSDVGKSVLCTALCRIFARKGFRTAPFKSQNMSNNSYITYDGKEIGRAQGIQAEAAMREATVEMNPILLKPRNDRDAEVICFGKVVSSMSGLNYRKHFYERGLEAIEEALQKLESNTDYLVIEGAGSPVEVNLNKRELVNMKVAELADVPVILIADIDRGGVFASLTGTIQLLEETQRKRVVGIFINKFRGDIQLFQDGIEWIEKNLNVPVLGVIPHLEGLLIEGEDSLSKEQITSDLPKHRSLDLAVIDLPYVSNYTDMEPFRFEDDVSVRFVDDARDFKHPDAVIIPGTKSTFHDLSFLKKQGLDVVIKRYVEEGGTVVGICGGYQMLGDSLYDEAGTDTGEAGAEMTGLGIAPIKTTFAKDKKTVRSVGKLLHPFDENDQITGFEIHLGVTERTDPACSSFLDVGTHEDGVYLKDGRVIGTYFHHLFFNDEWRTSWLNALRRNKGLPEKTVHNIAAFREQSYNRLADAIEEVVDVETLIRLIDEWRG
ncbi:cobyric acid synthase [Halalkalibacterium ligniniphilum]|uniref:cobyric acid synthase n=1 Tax=Halalkalibacterium ligniniphilum TaxID=1134413 RepID=UPI00034BF6C5|nr:cobyric acid synthase [Halalkalibacterium ligniniphilum]